MIIIIIIIIIMIRRAVVIMFWLSVWCIVTGVVMILILIRTMMNQRTSIVIFNVASFSSLWPIEEEEVGRSDHGYDGGVFAFYII